MGKDWIRREIVNGNYRYYQKYICQYCGKEFEELSTSRKIRCDECRAKERKRINRDNQKKWKEKTKK